jgi:lysyl-tRNA synthetase class I
MADKSYVKWKVFTLIIVMIFSAISGMFARSVYLSDKINDNDKEIRIEISQINSNMSTIAEAVEWLKDFKPPETQREISSNVVNPYKQIEKIDTKILDEFIDNLENRIEEVNNGTDRTGEMEAVVYPGESQ